MGLDALVKGYVEGTQLNQKRAKELADKAADQFTQQFKLQQAQQQAQQQEIENKIRKQEADTQAAYAKIAGQKEADAVEAKKATDATNRLRIEAQVAVGMGKLDMADHKAVNEQFLKLKQSYLQQGKSPSEATLYAAQDMKDLETRQTVGVPQPQGMPAAASGATQGPQQQTGNPIADMLAQRRYHGIQGPSETPSGYDQQTPRQVLEAELKTQQAAAAKTLADKREQEAAIVKQNEEADVQILKNKAKLSEIQIKKINAETEHILKMGPLQVADLAAQTAERKARTAEIISKTSVDLSRESRLSIESTLKNNREDFKAKSDLIELTQKGLDQKNRLNEEVEKTYKTIAAYDAAIADADAKHEDAKKAGYVRAKTALSIDLETLTKHYNQANNEYLQAQVLASEYKAHIPRTADNKPDTKAAEANQRALEKAKREAERKSGHGLPPAPIAPPGTKIGELAVKPAHKKKIEKKRGKVVYSSGGVTIREK